GDESHRFVAPSPVTVGALMLRTEGFLEISDHRGIDGPVDKGHDQLVGLPLVMQGSGALEFRTRADEAVRRERLGCLSRERIPGIADLRGIGLAQNPTECPRVLILDIPIYD